MQLSHSLHPDLLVGSWVVSCLAGEQQALQGDRHALNAALVQTVL